MHAVGFAVNAIVGTNASGTLDSSFMPPGIGADIIVATASESLAAGAMVNIWSNAGVLSARNADSGTANGGKKAHGFVLAAVASSASASIYRSGQNTGVTGLTVGTEYYLGATGAVTPTATSTSGTTLQYVGVPSSATDIDVQLGQAYGISGPFSTGKRYLNTGLRSSCEFAF